ncbi:MULTISPECIES: hypothetical protein [Vibrio]|uniref:hypothetical protein n=1 Tax=Vibrio TaxID=662 RepID=UPI000361352B|nr:MULTISPECIES: hypothetical protein [Vibrio]OEE56643.1 hypothetical protein A146_02745 [Vibrio splendidus FF-500]PHX03659.1 hypothetical protein VSPL_48830 [Vibrio splendidus]PMG19443.1 hypothetical protein BCU96_08510 [Vibrio lentus]PMN17773.1 hypothetical protein BCT39_15400 [Vibrio lentus]
MTHFPKVGHEVSFDDFYKLIPEELSNFPESVLRQWVYEHGKGDGDVVDALNLIPNLSQWDFQLVELSNAEIESIKHYPYDEKRLLEKGEWWVRSGRHSAPAFCNFMLEQGTTPAPLIVARNASNHSHPILEFRYPGHEGPMLKPLHLLEGNRRFALLRAMINKGTASLKDKHSVWVVTFPEQENT